MAKNRIDPKHITASDEFASVEVQAEELLAVAKGRGFAFLVICRQHDFPCEGTIHDSRDELICDLGNIITCRIEIVAVYQGERKLDQVEVDFLCNVAFEDLGPISQSKASGKAGNSPAHY